MNNAAPYGIKERSIALGIALSFITFGIYELYWIYKLHQETNMLTNRYHELRPGVVVLLCIVTLGIYEVYWAYTQGEKFRDEARMRGSAEADDCPMLFLILEAANYFIGVTSIVNKALMQNRIHTILRENNWNSRPYDRDRYTARETMIAREYEAAEAEYNKNAAPDARTDIPRLP